MLGGGYNEAMAKETEEEKKQREMVEEIATNIARLSREVRAIVGGRLREDAVVTLLVHATKLPRYNVEAVLKAIGNLEKNTLK